MTPTHPIGAAHRARRRPWPIRCRTIQREPIHRLSEVRLLRDLCLRTEPATNGATR
jgi:hypothetical protein